MVLVDIDGIRADTFENAYLKGKLPNFARILGEVGDGKGFSTAVWFEKATSVFPSVTMAGQASIFTGAQPARHGIPGNHWFDRATGRVIDYFSLIGTPCIYGFLPLGVGDCAGGLANRHLQTRTIYEAATAAGKTSTVVFSQFWKGATHAVLPSIAEIGFLAHDGSVDYAKFDAAMMAHAIASLHEYGLPDILTVYFDGADVVGHLNGTAAQSSYFEKAIDPLLGRLLDTIEALDKEWRRRTQFIITSDHGRTDSPPAPEDQPIEAQMQKALERAGFNREQFRIVKDGGLAHVYLRSRTPGARWTVQPRAEDVLAAAKELFRDAALRALADSIVYRGNGPGLGYTASGDGGTLSEERRALFSAMDSPRTGDLLLLLKRGHYFDNKAPAGAQHGNIHPLDRAVPIVVALGGVNPGRSPAPISTGDIARIVATYLGFAIEHEP